MAKIDTIVTKTAERPHPFGSSHTYKAHISPPLAKYEPKTEKVGVGICRTFVNSEMRETN